MAFFCFKGICELEWMWCCRKCLYAQILYLTYSFSEAPDPVSESAPMLLSPENFTKFHIYQVIRLGVNSLSIGTYTLISYMLLCSFWCLFSYCFYFYFFDWHLVHFIFKFYPSWLAKVIIKNMIKDLEISELMLDSPCEYCSYESLAFGTFWLYGCYLKIYFTGGVLKYM